MKLFGLDFESTGLDTSTARVTEIGYALWENGPMLTGNAFLLDDGIRKELENPETLAMIKKSLRPNAGDPRRIRPRC